MWSKLVAFWNGLPHLIQAAIAAFAGAAFSVLWTALKAWANGQAVCTVAFWPCVGGYLSQAVKGGIIAIGGLYTKSSFYNKRA